MTSKEMLLDMVVAFAGVPLKAFDQCKAAVHWLSECDAAPRSQE